MYSRSKRLGQRAIKILAGTPDIRKENQRAADRLVARHGDAMWETADISKFPHKPKTRKPEDLLVSARNRAQAKINKGLI